MDQTADFEIFLMVPPGLEHPLAAEARELGFKVSQIIPGGVITRGTWPDVWRANLCLRGATRVLARIGEFRAFHLAQLDKRARKFPWSDVLRADIPVRVETTTNKKSKIYHAGAATQRIERALTEELGVQITEDAPLTVKLRIDDNTCVFSIDTSGDALHKRGHKVAVGKAPMRETMAAMFLRDCGFTGGEPVVDPMCGSGTFVLEAAEIAAGLFPGRSRSFAFEQLATFDPVAWENMKQVDQATQDTLSFFGSDRNVGAVENSQKNAERAGVAGSCQFTHASISDLQPLAEGKGLVIINPPYGARIGNKKLLFALYGTMGEVLKARFKGWRVGIVTSDTSLANATKLPFLPTGAPVAHGGLKVRLFKTDLLR